MSLQSLFQSIRSAATTGCWSRGIELARRDGVSQDGVGGDEIRLRVVTPGRAVAPSVWLHGDDGEWDCDCDAVDDPCEHVTAAVIALRRAGEEGRSLAGRPETGGLLGYRFARRGRELELSRSVVTPDGEVPLRSSLTAIALGRVDGPAFVATDSDERVERVLDGRLRGVLPRTLMPKLLPLLAECDDVRLDGERVQTSGEALLPVLSVEDDGDGFRLRLGADGDVRETFANGAALCGDVLRPLAEARITQREREELPGGRYYPPGDAAELVSEILPSLASRVNLRIDTDRLPREEKSPPRLVVEVRREGEALGVHPMLVYGDPPIARVEQDQLICLGGPVPLRDRAAEDRLRRQLRRELELVPGHGLRLEAGEAIAYSDRLRAFSGQITGDDHDQFFRAAPLVPRLDLEAETFDADFETRVGDRVLRVPARRALAAWRRGHGLVPLPGGGFAELPADWMQRYGQTLADLVAAAGGTDSLPASALPDLARLCHSLGEPPPAGFDRLRALLEGFEGLPEVELPKDLRGELRGYQHLGVRWLCFLRDAGLGGLLADDMGLGKTLQALCSLRGRTLVVSPTSVVFGWQEQIERFRPGLRVSLYHGPARTLDEEADLVLTTYGILRLDAEALRGVDWDTVVLDEAQAIKNPDSQIARAAHALRAGFRLTLTGTPVENRLEELWSQLQFTNPGLLGTRDDFRHRYATPIGDGDPETAAHLRDRIRPFVLRRLKAEVAPELPPRTEVVLHCELSESQRQVYDAVRLVTRRDVLERLRSGGRVIEALEALLRLRQAACHPGLLPGSDAEGSCKVDVLLETLDEVVAEGHRALVFSQWTSFLDLVEPHLRHADLAFERLDGSTRDRRGVVSRFQADDGPPILLISLRAGGTGLNLTAADHVFLLDPWWNPAVEDQAADRAHRIGQTRPVMIHRLVSKDTVEEGILALQREKRGLAEAALSGAAAASALTREDLLRLLE